jgi:hypothetical protein
MRVSRQPSETPTPILAKLGWTRLLGGANLLTTRAYVTNLTWPERQRRGVVDDGIPTSRSLRLASPRSVCPDFRRNESTDVIIDAMRFWV